MDVGVGTLREFRKNAGMRLYTHLRSGENAEISRITQQIQRITNRIEQQEQIEDDITQELPPELSLAHKCGHLSQTQLGLLKSTLVPEGV